MSLQVIQRNDPSASLAIVAGHPAGVAGPFRHYVYHVADALKTRLVVKVLSSETLGKTIVYVKTNFAADQLAEDLNRAGLTAQSFHENKSQRTRASSLINFTDRATSVMVVTESAAIDICLAEVTTVISYNLPVSAETYQKRLQNHSSVAGSSAKAFLFCDKSELSSLSNINRALGEDIEVLEHSLT
jgi:ATP-dependent RNA helicase RhlE